MPPINAKLFNVFTVVLIAKAVAAERRENRRFCPKLFHKGVLELRINPAVLRVEPFNISTKKHWGRNKKKRKRADSLVVTSFFDVNYSLNPFTQIYVPELPPTKPDLVGRIENIENIDPGKFKFKDDFEKLTDLGDGPTRTIWPNDATRVPDSVLPFEGLIVPQGFFIWKSTGRLVIINLDDPNNKEYIVHESSFDPNLPPGHPDNTPRFYSKAIFYDIDSDGYDDIITARSGFFVFSDDPHGPPTGPPTTYPPFSELVWFRNPGQNIQPDTPWDETVLYGGRFVGFLGPDIDLVMHDFENDGIPEIVATHFFTGEEVEPGEQPTKGKIAIYGAPVGGSWLDVDASFPFALPRVKVIDDSQGFPNNVIIDDLDRDGTFEILASNHQPSCTPYPTIPGRLYILQPPKSGNIFVDEWSLDIIKDNIFPQPVPDLVQGPRLAPGNVQTFYSHKNDEKEGKRPWILLSGDESGKVYTMKPQGDDFEYDSAVIFDINDYYGPATTQAISKQGKTIHSIGTPAVRYNRDQNAEIYIPVYEAGHIHIMSFDTRKVKKSNSIKSKKRGKRQKYNTKSKGSKVRKSLSGGKRMEGIMSKKTGKKQNSHMNSKVSKGSGSFRGGKSMERLTCPIDVTLDCTV